MIDDKESHISASRDFEIEKPGKGRAYLVPVSEWDHVKQRILTIESGGVGSQTAGSIFAGVASTSLIGALTIPKEFTLIGISGSYLCFGLTLLFGICAVMAFYFAHRHRELSSHSRADVVSEMERIERRYGKPEAS